MRKQDQLVDLIHRLTPAEKKFFKEYTAKSKGNQSYLKLYELLQKQESYNAEDLCQKLGKTKANLAHEKDYLQEVLLGALRLYHEEMPDIATANIVSNIDVLYHKGAYAMARDMAAKALKEARQHSNFTAMIALHQRLMRITWFDQQDGDEKFQEHDRHSAAIRAAVNDAKDLVSLQDMQTELARIWNNSLESLQASQTDILKEKLNSEILQRHFSQPLFQMIQADVISTIHSLTGDREKGLEYKKKILAIMERYPLETRVTEHDYMAGVINVFNFMLGARHIDDAEAFLQKLQNRYYRKMPLDQGFLDKTFDAHYTEAMLSICMQQYPKGNKSEADVKKVLMRFKKTAHPEKDMLPISQIMPYFFAARLAFAAEMYDDSLDWFEVVISKVEKGNMLDAQIACRISVAAIHCLLGNYTVCQSQAISITKFIKSIRTPLQTEKLMLNFLSNIWRKAPTEVKMEFEQLKAKLLALRSDPAEALIQRMFHYDIWIERNLQRASRS